jgi:hypothetical protein
MYAPLLSMTCRQRSGKERIPRSRKFGGPLAEEVDEVHLEVVLVVKFFLAQMITKRTEQMLVHGSQVGRISWMWNLNPSEFQ